MASRVIRGIARPLLDRGIRRGWGVNSTPQPHFTPGKDPVPIVQEGGWAPGPVWTAAENLALPGFNPRTVQPVAQSLYRLSYLAHNFKYCRMDKFQAESDARLDKPRPEFIITVAWCTPVHTKYEHPFQRQMAIKPRAIGIPSSPVQQHNSLCNATLSHPIHLLIVCHFRERYLKLLCAVFWMRRKEILPHGLFSSSVSPNKGAINPGRSAAALPQRLNVRTHTGRALCLKSNGIPINKAMKTSELK
jgi:hypothetical protein